ncbi:hypothetical protein HGRIS_009715 [Hohenbuehelia grisea]|uniref:Ribosomal RNA-processing protein 8 n=1 Tax=Hohenbuehelia grisea TaxID=104357 RepID=A0ABR3J276_9AGAR
MWHGVIFKFKRLLSDPPSQLPQLAFILSGMALFEVPGWNVSSAPVTLLHESKKRKRPPSEDAGSTKIKSAEANFDKLFRKLSGGSARDESTPSSSRKDTGMSEERNAKKKSKATREKRDTESAKSRISHPMPLKAVAVVAAGTSSDRPKKKQKRLEETSEKSVRFAKPPVEEAETTQLTAMQHRMKQTLEGARFRVINESLYKSDSSEAVNMMKANPEVFEEYHTGFRNQVQSWPSNPVEGYISALSTYPKHTVIADLGCGDAALARALIPKGMTILSFDLVSDNAFVVEADTCSKIPLPGSEAVGPSKGVGEGHVVNVVICALSLMGTNWPNCIREAWRILTPDGELKIAEVTSRFSTVEKFTSLVESCGFKLRSSDKSNTHFTLFEFRKIARVSKSEAQWKDILSKASCLKPCEYKRR